GLAHWNCSIVALGIVGLLAWQAWLALGLFDSDNPWQVLLNDQPVISGQHGQHQYLGALGAQALAGSGTICVYDPWFAAGFPKTPIFNGSRFAELFLFAGGGSYNPAAYKVGLLVICLMMPLFLLLACFGAGLSRPASLLATALGIFLTWGPSGRQIIEAGE